MGIPHQRTKRQRNYIICMAQLKYRDNVKSIANKVQLTFPLRYDASGITRPSLPINFASVACRVTLRHASVTSTAVPTQPLGAKSRAKKEI